MFRQVTLSPNRSSRWPGTMFPHDLQRKSKDFLAAHVKRLCMPYHSMRLKGALEILASCTGLVDLAIWIDFTTRPYDMDSDDESDDSLADPEDSGEKDDRLAAEFFQGTLKSLDGLRNLSFIYDNLGGLQHFIATEPNPPGWCARLKYLDLVYWSEAARELPIAILTEMKSLTHLSFSPAALDPSAKDDFEVLSVLEARPTLQVVLILLDNVEGVLALSSSDVRVIYCPNRGIEPSKYWKEQYESKWIPAEEEIARRRALRSVE
jgi:hypothetical protein